MMVQENGEKKATRRSGWCWLLIAVPVAILLALLLCVLLAVSVRAIRNRRADANVITTVMPLPVGSSTHALTVGGRKRTYIVYRPADLPASAPLVVMLHGGYGSADQAEKTYGWNDEADREHFLVAYPDGLNRAWNTGGGCCGQSA